MGSTWGCHLMLESKKLCFTYLRDKVVGRLHGGLDRCLSMAGKEVDIKVVAQAIPTYAMACFDLTKTLCDEISRLICLTSGTNRTTEIKCIG